MEKDLSHLIRPFHPEDLLKERLFYPLYEQILFEYQGEIVLTTISDTHEYTKEDYLLLPEGAPYQFINGKLIFMSAPKINHQRILNKLNVILYTYVESNKLGEVFMSPTDVELDDKNIVQPDLFFVSIKRKAIIKEARVEGAPEFVVEILSPGTEKYDRNDKLAVYGKQGVEECWLVDLKNTSIEVYENQNRELKLMQIAKPGNKIKSKIIEGFELELDKLFEQE